MKLILSIFFGMLSFLLLWYLAYRYYKKEFKRTNELFEHLEQIAQNANTKEEIELAEVELYKNCRDRKGLVIDSFFYPRYYELQGYLNGKKYENTR